MTETADYPDRPDPLPDGWLTDAELAAVRSRLPILYVDAVPVRVDECGDVIAVGVLLRINGAGIITRSLVSGRVMYHERVRDALLRHIEKDLGPMALPRVPASPQPFTVAEYFPTPGVTPFHDPRQHAVSLAFVVPVAGDCAPQNDALDLTWLTPDQALDPLVQAEMERGHGVLLRQALAHLGHPV
jgi:ADP-ribose pyrophosphatase YjhB (NUDIX family)